MTDQIAAIAVWTAVYLLFQWRVGALSWHYTSWDEDRFWVRAAHAAWWAGFALILRMPSFVVLAGTLLLVVITEAMHALTVRRRRRRADRLGGAPA